MNMLPSGRTATVLAALALVACGKDTPRAPASEARKESPSDVVATVPSRAVDGTACKDAESCRMACEKGNAASCDTLSGFYYYGSGGVFEDKPRAFMYAQKACDGKVDAACTFVASCYLDGDGVAADPNRGLEIATGACARGTLQACELLTGVYEEREARALADKYRARSLELAAGSCEKAQEDCDTAAELSAARGRAEDVARFNGLYLVGLERGCDAGNRDACETRARYGDDYGVRRKFYQRFCEITLATKADEVGGWTQNCDKTEGEIRAFLDDEDVRRRF